MPRFANRLAIVLLLALLFTSCDSALDDVAPIGELNSETFYNTERDFEAASLAPYSTILNLYFDQLGQGWFQGMLYPDDDVRNPQGNNDQEEFNWLPDNGHFSFVWSQSYKGIMRANVILDRLPKATGFADESTKPRFEAEARFIRAYFYFILARNFGNVPIVSQVVTSLGDANVGNSAPGEVWDFIEEDLTFAKANLPPEWDTENIGRATSYAAGALLGKVNLFRAQWTGDASHYGPAIQEFDAIVNSGVFHLVDDFGDNFRIETENNPESIFEVQMTRGDFNPWLPTDFGLEQNQNVGAAGSGRKIFMGAGCHLGECAPGANAYGYGQVHITTSLQNAFEPDDPRIVHTYYRAGEDYAGNAYDPSWSITGATPAKYMRPFDASGFPLNITTNNERVIRYSDVLLMLAEAELLGNGNVARAAGLINQVRERARANFSRVNPDATPPDNLLPERPSSASVDQMFEWLMHERRVELALEVHRYDDLVRWHRAGLIDIARDIDFGNSLAQQSWNETYLLKPIPQGEIDNNPNLSQNPGY